MLMQVKMMKTMKRIPMDVRSRVLMILADLSDFLLQQRARAVMMMVCTRRTIWRVRLELDMVVRMEAEGRLGGEETVARRIMRLTTLSLAREEAGRRAERKEMKVKR